MSYNDFLSHLQQVAYPESIYTNPTDTNTDLTNPTDTNTGWGPVTVN